MCLVIGWVKKNYLSTAKRVSVFGNAFSPSELWFLFLFFLLESNFAELTDAKIYSQTLLKVVDMYGNLALSAVLIASFILLYKTKFFKKIAGGLRYCGRMSLTAYVLQSMIGGFVFFGYGLGIGPSVLHTKSLAIGIVLFAILFYFCKFWINRYGQGPLEKLWHKLTWIGFSSKRESNR